MPTIPHDDDQDRLLGRLPILDSSFDDFLAEAEHELLCRQREVRTLRRHVRRQHLHERNLPARAARFLGKALRMELAFAGTLASIGGTVLLITGDSDAARNAFVLSAAAWGATTIVPTTRT